MSFPPVSLSTRRIVRRRSSIHGFGVFALVDLAEGECIIQYKGERISSEEADRRQEVNERENHHTFFFSLDDGDILDGDSNGNSARFINHSCNPNCFAQEENGKIFIYALRSIKAQEELFFDYNLVAGKRHTQALRDQYRCHCRASNCRGTMLMDRRKKKTTS